MSAATQFLLFILVNAQYDEERYQQYNYYANDEHQVAATQVVAFHAVPHIKHSFSLGVAVVHQ